MKRKKSVMHSLVSVGVMLISFSAWGGLKEDLQKAILANQLEKVEELLKPLEEKEKKELFEQGDEKGNTPFHLALSGKAEDAFWTLYSYLPEDENVTLTLYLNLSRNNEGRTPIHNAVEHSTPSLLLDLIDPEDGSGNLFAQDNSGITPLDLLKQQLNPFEQATAVSKKRVAALTAHAIYNKNLWLFKELMERANASRLSDRSGNTFLHVIVKNVELGPEWLDPFSDRGNLNVLLAHQNKKGKTPWDLAKERTDGRASEIRNKLKELEAMGRLRAALDELHLSPDEWNHLPKEQKTMLIQEHNLADKLFPDKAD